MNRILRTLGLALAALTAFCAVAVGNAEATEFHSELSTTFLSGSSGEIVVTTPAGAMKCKKSNLNGTQSGRSASTLSISPTIAECSFFGQAMPVAANGCTFEIAASGHLSIACPAGKKIVFSMPSGNCSWEIGAQKPTTDTVGIANRGTGTSRSEEWAFGLNGITYTDVGPGTLCGSQGVHEGASGLSITGNYTVRGYANASFTEQSGIWASSEDGLYLTGAGSEEEANQPKIAAEQYPATVSGSQSTELKFTTAAGRVKCKSVTFGAGQLSGPTAQLSLSTTYGSCTAFGQTATISMNSCHYSLSVANAGPPYVGSLQLACSVEGDGIVVSVPSGNCSLKIPAQSIASLSLATTGSGFERHVTAGLAGEGSAYTVSGPGTICGVAGSHSDGTTTGGIDLSATAP